MDNLTFKLKKNAKINAQLMETLKECTLVQDKKQNKLF
jgi:hypothetical protein